jgi:hypothetical protein
MTKRTSWSRPGLAAFALGLAAGPAPATEPTPAPKARIVVAKETTYFLGPLKPDGTVDYAAALNGIQGKGLTPDDNAAVLILPVFGPRILKDRPDAAVATARIGARPLPPTGDYFLPADEHEVTGGRSAVTGGRSSRDEQRRGRRHLARAHRRAAGRAQVLVELAVGKHEQEPLADGTGRTAPAAEEDGGLQGLERTLAGTGARPPRWPRRHGSRLTSPVHGHGDRARP